MTVVDPEVPAPTPPTRRDALWAWGVGLVAALVVIGPGLGPGAWLNLDLVVTDVTPVPRGVWGMGPELPRRVPFALPFAWISALVPGELAWKLAAVAALASGVAGTWRLVARWAPDSSPWVRAGAGLVAGVGPFATTRLGAGHLGMTFALAVLPWALPALLRPLGRPARTVAWALALGLTGPFGGTLVVPVVVCGLLAEVRVRRGADGSRPSVRGVLRHPALRVAVGTIVAQGPWLVPTLVVALQGTDIATAGDFPTDTSGAGGPLRVLAGHGFWRDRTQIGGAQGWEVPIAGLVLAGLAVVGWRRLPDEQRRPVALVAGVGLVGALASATPGIDRLFAAVVDTAAGSALREGQRMLALWLAVAAPLAALGADALARRAAPTLAPMARALPLVIAVLGVGPALWGVGGALDPVDLPPAWDEVRDAIGADPGPVLVLPWVSYPSLAVTGGRQVVQPLPVYLGGDVLVSSHSGSDDGARERSDGREPRAAALAERLVAGEDVRDELIDLGVRWVVELPRQGRRIDPDAPPPTGLVPVVVSTDISLHQVPGWWPARRVADGAPVVDVDRPIAPLLRTDDEAVRVAAPGSTGWRRAGASSTSEGGLLTLPGGGEVAWYPGALAVLAADAAALALAVACGWRVRRTRAERDSDRRDTRTGG